MAMITEHENVLLYRKRNSTEQQRKESSDKFNSQLAELNATFNESASIYSEYLYVCDGCDYASES